MEKEKGVTKGQVERGSEKCSRSENGTRQQKYEKRYFWKVKLRNSTPQQAFTSW